MITTTTPKACSRCHFTDVTFIRNTDAVCVTCHQLEDAMKHPHEYRVKTRRNRNYRTMGLSPCYAISTFGRIRDFASKHFGVPLDIMARYKTPVTARHCVRWCYFASMQITGLPLGSAARFWGKDHSTITHALSELAKEHEADPHLKARDEMLVKTLHAEVSQQ